MSVDNLLSDGLKKGFGGPTNIKKITRGSFKLISSHYEEDNEIYHDE